jgi:ParB-like chromosome segregation protein Spo0J
VSRKQPLTLAEGWEALLDQHSNGKPAPKGDGAERRMPLRRIKTRPEIFQHRRPAGHASAAHVKELAAVAKEHALEPILVWWDGRHWTCIDGHHRIEAYRKAGVSYEVPVKVFKGTPEEASLQAARGNSRAKLPMSPTEKLGAAWRIVTTTKASKHETADASGASERTVANMRRVREKLLQLGQVPAELSWQAGRRLASGEAPNDEVDWEARIEQEAQGMANKLLAALGKRGQQRVDALARALEIYSSRLPGQLMECWANLDDQEEAEL